jgi:phosphohistidine swiveling domain-containing protein
VAEIKKYPNEHIIFITKSNVPREVNLQSEIDGYISEEGGVTSHAALVSIGKLPCIVGVKWRKYGSRVFLGDTVDMKEGEVITLDANDGYIYRGKLPIQASSENDPEYLEAEKAILEIYGKAEEYTIIPAALY